MKLEKQIEEWAKIVESQSENNTLTEANFINFDEGSFIGKFSVEEKENLITEMGAIGKISNPHTYYVYIHGREGMTPHFHVFDKEGEHKTKNQREGVHSCVEIKNNKYFKHGSHTDSLDKETRKALDDFMREIRVKGKYSSDIGVSNYTHTIREWNDNNAEFETPNWVDEDIPQPDYTKII